MNSALYFADFFSIAKGNREFFVIGGAQMYSIFDAFINKIYLTEVFSSIIRGDAKFDFDFDPSLWKTIKEEDFPASNHDQYPFRVSVKHKKKPVLREELIDRFLRPNAELTALRARAEQTSGIDAGAEFVRAAEQLYLDLDNC